MTSLSYQNFNSRFFSKVQAYDILDLTEIQLTGFMTNWLHSAFSKPYIRRLFSSFLMDDEIQEVQFEMKYVVDTNTDADFIYELISMGMIIEWLEPKINSILNISQMYGSKEEKFYAQANHLSQLQALKDSLYQSQRRMIADRGYAWNTYIDGES